MESSIKEIIPILGTSMDGGFYAGRIKVDGQPFALILLSKAEGEHRGVWIPRYKDVPGAKSYNDGLANTQAMAEAGSGIAKKAIDLGAYIPALDELEVIYRNLKPTARENYCYMRSGINVNAIEPTAPYAPDFTLQTQTELFQAGGAEAFAEEAYWTSTQYASDSVYAWYQYFLGGYQRYAYKYYKLRARFVRRLPI